MAACLRCIKRCIWASPSARSYLAPAPDNGFPRASYLFTYAFCALAATNCAREMIPVRGELTLTGKPTSI
jgi:hypothetical protein